MTQKLNPEQRQAVETLEGPVLVLSGAGTGKTTVLTSRLVHIVQSGKALPFQCLAVTFTNKASKEMSERLHQMIGNDASNLWLGTFHRIALKILRNHASKVGLNSSFSILDASDQERLMKQILIEKNADLQLTPPIMILSQIQRLKDQGLTPQKALKTTSKSVYDFYTLYQERLQRMNAVDFGDLLLYCLELFQNNPAILSAFQAQFKYILVDEYQDTNVAQYLWLRLLAQKHNNICCVGDDDQSIYSWRGAEVGNILRFEKDFPNATLIRLERNYRSTKHILGGASGLIAHNTERLGKTLRVAEEKGFEGEKISVHSVWNADDEARTICENIEKSLRSGTRLNQMAVLVRASFQTRAIENQLVSFGLTYKIIAGMKFYDREEIKDAIAYVRLLVYPKDDMAFSRIVNKPRRGVGDTALQNIHATARNQNMCLFEAGKFALNENTLKGTAKKGLESFYGLFEKWTNLNETQSPDEILRILLKDSGYRAMWEADKSPESPGKLENLGELMFDLKSNFDTLEEFLEHVSLRAENDALGALGDYISVMTLHASKGLEFDVVFLPGWEEGLFPHQRSLDDGGQNALEEERRLAYVGLTRARKKIYITYANSRQVYNQWQNNLPSRFISEIPTEHIETKNTFKQFAQKDAFFVSNTAPARQYFTTPKKRAFQIGTNVYHKSFGTGKVIECRDKNVDVLFESCGLKKLMADYLEKA